MQFMIEWKTKDLARFLERGHGIKVVTSAHVVGEGAGYMVVEASDLPSVHAATAKWADLLHTTVKAIISDAEAKSALS